MTPRPLQPRAKAVERVPQLVLPEARVLELVVHGLPAGAGLDDVRIHDLRHSFASRAPALGEGLPMIGRLLGHTQVQTTARYAHLALDTVKASAARIGDGIERDLVVETD